MQRELMDMQMNFLLSRVGSEVRCVYWERGECKQATGKLSTVYPYDRISVGGKPIPFVSNSIAIESVDIAGKEIYLCPKARGYQGCYGTDRFEVVKNQQDLLGRSIDLEKLNEVYDNAPDIAKPHIIEGGRGFGK